MPKDRTLYDELCRDCVKNDICPRVDTMKNIVIHAVVDTLGLPEGVSVKEFRCKHLHSVYHF